MSSNSFLVMPMSDPTGLLHVHMWPILPQLKTLFDQAIVSYPPETQDAQAIVISPPEDRAA